MTPDPNPDTAQARIDQCLIVALREDLAAVVSECDNLKACREVALIQEESYLKQLIELRKELAELKINHKAVSDSFDSAGIELAALRANEGRPRNYAAYNKPDPGPDDSAALLDWLETHKEEIFGVWWEAHPLDQSWTITGNPTDSYSGGIDLGSGPTLRDAIKAAMSK
jgi:hypothetical protein